MLRARSRNWRRCGRGDEMPVRWQPRRRSSLAGLPDVRQFRLTLDLGWTHSRCNYRLGPQNGLTSKESPARHQAKTIKSSLHSSTATEADGPPSENQHGSWFHPTDLAQPERLPAVFFRRSLERRNTPSPVSTTDSSSSERVLALIWPRHPPLLSPPLADVYGLFTRNSGHQRVKESVHQTFCKAFRVLSSKKGGVGEEWFKRRDAGRGKRKNPEKSRRPALSSGLILTCENPGATPPGTKAGSLLWEGWGRESASASLGPLSRKGGKLEIRLALASQLEYSLRHEGRAGKISRITGRQLCAHWLRLQRVASVTPHLAVWDSLRVSLQDCYWLSVVQRESDKLADFRTWESSRATQLIGGFSRGSPVSPPSTQSGAAPYSPLHCLADAGPHDVCEEATAWCYVRAGKLGRRHLTFGAHLPAPRRFPVVLPPAAVSRPGRAALLAPTFPVAWAAAWSVCYQQELFGERRYDILLVSDAIFLASAQLQFSVLSFRWSLVAFYHSELSHSFIHPPQHKLGARRPAAVFIELAVTSGRFNVPRVALRERDIGGKQYDQSLRCASVIRNPSLPGLPPSLSYGSSLSFSSTRPRTMRSSEQSGMDPRVESRVRGQEASVPIRATLTRTSSASSLLRARRAVFPAISRRARASYRQRWECAWCSHGNGLAFTNAEQNRNCPEEANLLPRACFVKLQQDSCMTIHLHRVRNQHCQLQEKFLQVTGNDVRSGGWGVGVPVPTCRNRGDVTAESRDTDLLTLRPNIPRASLQAGDTWKDFSADEGQMKQGWSSGGMRVRRKRECAEKSRRALVTSTKFSIPAGGRTRIA
ncbi:hypothetical protein PR048_014279 [Dryococelus australis]|uniref:Uncharacterized protein n=1 Tax=Dryococelus australis TaxID=614101 RepID=A0ABQ9HDY0_9NEOP|nr:hypothetical protein PR048_014279 [Dryococelus australis]